MSSSEDSSSSSSKSQGDGSEVEEPIVNTVLKGVDALLERVRTKDIFPNSVRQKAVDLWCKCVPPIRTWAQKLKELPEDPSKASDDQLMEVYRARAHCYFYVSMLEGGLKNEMFVGQFLHLPIYTRAHRACGIWIQANLQESVAMFGTPWGVNLKGELKHPPEFDDAYNAITPIAQKLQAMDDDLKPVWRADTNDISDLKFDMNRLWQTCQELMIPLNEVVERRDDTLLPRVKEEFGMSDLNDFFYTISQGKGRDKPYDLARYYKAWFPPAEADLIKNYDDFVEAFRTLQELIYTAKEDPPLPGGCCNVA